MTITGDRSTRTVGDLGHGRLGVVGVIAAGLGSLWGVALWHALSGVVCGGPDSTGMCPAPLLLVGYVPVLLALSVGLLLLLGSGRAVRPAVAVGAMVVAVSWAGSTALRVLSAVPEGSGTRLALFLVGGVVAGLFAGWTVHATRTSPSLRAATAMLVLVVGLVVPRLGAVERRALAGDLASTGRTFYLPTLAGVSAHVNTSDVRYPYLLLIGADGTDVAQVFVDRPSGADPCAPSRGVLLGGCSAEGSGFTLHRPPADVAADATVVGEMRGSDRLVATITGAADPASVRAALRRAQELSAVELVDRARPLPG